MTLTLKDLSHFETMDWLEKKAERKALSAARKLSSVAVPVKSLALTEKLVLLSSKLREKGFSKAAEELEGTLLHYRKNVGDVEDALYHTNPETGDDLLFSAHPDGDVEVAVAKNHQGDVETLPSEHEKILEIVIAPAKKSVILSMLRTSLNVKLADVPAGVSDPNNYEKRKNGYDEFSAVTNEIINTINYYVHSSGATSLFSNPKYDVALVDGSSIAKYKENIEHYLKECQNAINSYDNYVKNNDVNSKNGATKWPNLLLNECLNMGKAIFNTMQSSSFHLPPGKGFDNAKFPTQLTAECKALQHRWYKFWADYGAGTEEDGKFHAQFITPGQIKEAVGSQLPLFSDVESEVKKLLSASKTQSSKEVTAYLNDMLGYIGDVRTALSSLGAGLDKAITNVDELGSFDNLKMENVKNLIKDTSVSSVLNFTGVNEFKKSINDLYGSLVQRIYELINENPLYESVKASLLPNITRMFNNK